MVQSKAATPEEYLDELDPDRRAVVGAIRQLVNDHLPHGYVEVMRWGMISWEVPLEDFPDTYNGQPLAYLGLASQKRHVSLYLMGLYADGGHAERFEHRFAASGKTLDMGKSCLRFRTLDDLPLDLISETVAATTVDDYIARYEAARA